MAVGDHIKTIITVAVSATIGIGGVMYGVGKDVGANKAVVDVKDSATRAQSKAEEADRRITEFKAEVTKAIDELKKTITEEGEKTRKAVQREGVKNAGGRQP